jgi:rubrerythrin
MRRVASIRELYADAIAIEREAAERYAELAERMRDESREELAALFAGLAQLEAGHLEALERMLESTPGAVDAGHESPNPEKESKPCTSTS